MVMSICNLSTCETEAEGRIVPRRPFFQCSTPNILYPYVYVYDVHDLMDKDILLVLYKIGAQLCY